MRELVTVVEAPPYEKTWQRIDETGYPESSRRDQLSVMKPADDLRGVLSLTNAAAGPAGLKWKWHD